MPIRIHSSSTADDARISTCASRMFAVCRRVRVDRRVADVSGFLREEAMVRRGRELVDSRSDLNYKLRFSRLQVPSLKWSPRF